jgi:hypothetical protein
MQFLYVGLPPSRFFSVIVIHDHSIDIQDDNIRPGDAKTPDEHGHMDFSEAQDKWPGKGIPKAEAGWKAWKFRKTDTIRWHAGMFPKKALYGA